jgi:hypothetical protein
LKQLQEAVGNTLEQLGIGNDFLIRTQKAHHRKETMNKCYCLKVSAQQRKVYRLKRQPTEWEKIFVSYLSSEGLISTL